MIKRRYELDICRIFACCMVVMLHVAASNWYIDPWLREWRVANLYDMAVRAGVPLFFMISGALFLERDSISVTRLLSRNVVRLFVVYFVWSLAYAIVHQNLFHSYTCGEDFVAAVIIGHHHLWFIPAMILVYLFIPVIHSALHEHERISPLYIIIVFLLVCVLKTNLLLIPELSKIVKEFCYKVNLYHISYFLYIILGYALSKIEFKRKFVLSGTVLIYFGVTVLAAYGNRRQSLIEGKAIEWLYGEFALPVLIQACCIFIFFQYFRDIQIRHPKILKYVSDCTLGVYLVHPMILEYWQRHGFAVSGFNPIYSAPCVFLVVVLESFLVSAILNAMPLVKRAILIVDSEKRVVKSGDV